MKKYLNKREEIIMKILWKLDRAFLKEIIAEYPEPKPPTTTIASIVKKLQDRGLITHKVFGKTNQYLPALKEEEYTQSEIKSLVQDYFSGSFEDLVSFFYKKEDANIEELNKIYEQIKSKEK
jgi:BlaI family penicillinase repressor